MAGARFCDACGASTAGAAQERKLVTVLFADVVNSMSMAAALDPERLRQVMREVFNGSAAIVQRYRGTVDKFTGDGLMALFGAPVALEDHALALDLFRQSRSDGMDIGRALTHVLLIAHTLPDSAALDDVCAAISSEIADGDVIFS